jgi:hypothetical protein
MTGGETVMSCGHGAAACVGGTFDWPILFSGGGIFILQYFLDSATEGL